MTGYDAFVSYSHAKDKPVAAALQSVVQKLGKPWYRRRALRVFRDDTSLSATPHLWPSIERALSQSRYLILLASPMAASSPWVSKELMYWLDHKSVDTLLIAVTTGNIEWDEEDGDFRWSSTNCLPPVLVGRFPTEPKWVDLRAYTNGANLDDAKFTEQAADFAAAVHNLPKEDLLSQEVRQQKRALTLAWSAAALLLGLAGIAGWQSWAARVAEQAAQASERVAIEQREQATNERDRAQRALLDSAARASLLQTREGRADEGWDSVRQALAQAKDQLPRSLPGLISQAGLTALVDNRFGPEAILPLGERSRKAEPLPVYSMGEPSVIAAFDPSGERVAIGRSHDLMIMATTTEQPPRQFIVDHSVARLRFHDKENILAVVGQVSDQRTQITLIDLGDGTQRLFELRQCRGPLPCIAGAGSENGQLVPLHKYERLGEAMRTGIAGVALLVPDAGTIEPEFVGTILDRFYVFKAKSEFIVFDSTAQQVRRAPWNERTINFAVAPSKPIVATSDGNTISVLQIDIDPKNSTRVALKRLRSIEADDHVSELRVGDDGSLLYYSTGPLGSSGRGGHTTGAYDLQSGRMAWLVRLIGSTLYGPRQDYAARLRFDPRTGLQITQFVNGKTSEPLFSVPGIAVAFDPRGRFALMEMKNDLLAYGTDFDAARAAPARLRLVELSTIDSFASEGRTPEGMRDDCATGSMAFRTLSDRTERLWNTYDWRSLPDQRRPETGSVSIDRGIRQPQFSLKWKGEHGELSRTTGDRTTLVSQGTVKTITFAIPDWADLIVPGVDMLIGEHVSADRRYVAVERRLFGEKNQLDWNLYRIEEGRRHLIKRGPSNEDGGNFIFRSVFFIESLLVAAVQEDGCSVTFLALPDGRVLGKVRAAYDTVENVVRVADDLIAVASSGRRDARQSIQIFDFPDLNPGPWFMSGDLQGDSDDDQRDAAPGKKPQRPPIAATGPAPVKPLVNFEWFKSEIADNGRVLFLERTIDDKKSEWFALAIPPWGQRLRQLMIAP